MKPNITKIVESLFSMLPFQRKQMLQQMRGNNPHLINSISFVKKYNEFAQIIGIKARELMHRQSCLTGYTAKRLKVEAMQGNHKFIHPNTPA